MNLFDKSEEEEWEFMDKCILRLLPLKDKKETADTIYQILTEYTFIDLQKIGSRIYYEVEKLPYPYRRSFKPYSQDLLNQYHKIMSEHRKGIIPDGEMDDPKLWQDYWLCTKDACSKRTKDINDPTPRQDRLSGELFYRLVYGYVIFLKNGYGHPIGMPFPGGFRIYEKCGRVYCPIRDKEKDLPQALCNFCPAEQDPDYK